VVELDSDVKRKILKYLEKTLKQKNYSLTDLTLDKIHSNLGRKRYEREDLEYLLKKMAGDEGEDAGAIIKKEFQASIYLPAEFEEKLNIYSKYLKPAGVRLTGAVFLSIAFLLIIKYTDWIVPTVPADFVYLGIWTMMFLGDFVGNLISKAYNHLTSMASDIFSVGKKAITTISIVAIIFMLSAWFLAPKFEYNLSFMEYFIILGIGITSGAFIWQFVIQKKNYEKHKK